MPIHVEWAPEPYIRLSRISGVFTTEEAEAWLQAEIALLHQQSDTVHHILDLTANERITANLIKMPIVSDFLGTPHVGWFGIVGASPLVSFWVELLSRSHQLRFRVFPTADDAAEFLLALVRIAKENSTG